jgi:PhnB protein
MDLTTYLTFNGKCAAAFRFYERALDGHIEMMMTNGESPAADQMPPDQHNRVMHASLRIGDRILQGGDAPPQHFAKPAGFCVSYGADSLEEAERVFGALSEGGTIQMPLQKTFWTSGFGMLIDQFGIPWMVNTEQAPGS